jgi:hypothetical protein
MQLGDSGFQDAAQNQLSIKPKNQIMLAFYQLEHRVHGEYAAQ